MKSKQNDLLEQRVCFSESFIASFLIREKLASIRVPDEACDTSEDICLRPMNVFNPFPWEGQIRLLSQTDSITYVLLARKWGDGAFLVIPFSQYADPATDMELKVRHDAGAYLQVLQIWNARTLQTETLRRSWLIGKMNPDDLKEALQLWEYSVGGQKPEASVIARTGVPISRREDPRILYQDQVLQNFAQLDAADLQLASSGKAVEGVALKPIWRETPALAAGDKLCSTVRRSICRVKGFAGEVEIVYSKTRRRLSLEVFDASGAVSSALDGWRFLYHDGTDFGVITKGHVAADHVLECDGACCLLDTEGAICVLMPKKGRR